MNLVVLGATGGTGLEIVRQAIGRGHSVTAFARSPEKLGAFRGDISIWQGDLLNRSELQLVLRGHDAVLSGFGPRLPVKKEERNLLERFARALSGAMAGSGVSRVLLESVAFLFRDSVIPPAYLFGRLFFPGIVADAAAMEAIFESSRLDWTIIRPPELTNKPRTGEYRIREEHLPRFGFRIARADVADFMLNAVERHLASRKIVGLAY